MEEQNSVRGLPTEQWTVGEVLTHYPDTASVFTKLRMACVGCVMAPFESVREVAMIYGLDPNRVLCALHDVCRAESARWQERNEKENVL
ncbi:MAG TPA: DUF1858 domain-containing protein [Acidobacteriota bacterium]|nr:DUF1858 domain-containing protein [Acidobacteriota bacterium]